MVISVVIYMMYNHDRVAFVVCKRSSATPPEVHLMLGEMVACAAVSLHLYLLPYIEVQCIQAAAF